MSYLISLWWKDLLLDGTGTVGRLRMARLSGPYGVANLLARARRRHDIHMRKVVPVPPYGRDVRPLTFVAAPKHRLSQSQGRTAWRRVAWTHGVYKCSLVQDSTTFPSILSFFLCLLASGWAIHFLNVCLSTMFSYLESVLTGGTQFANLFRSLSQASITMRFSTLVLSLIPATAFAAPIPAPGTPLAPKLYRTAQT